MRAHTRKYYKNLHTCHKDVFGGLETHLTVLTLIRRSFFELIYSGFTDGCSTSVE